jgi:hypothetical protein
MGNFFTPDENVFKIIPREDFKKNENELFELSETLKKNGYVLIDPPQQIKKYIKKYLKFSDKYFNSNNPRYNQDKIVEYDKEIPIPPIINKINYDRYEKNNIDSKINDNFIKDNNFKEMESRKHREFIDFNSKLIFSSNYDVFYFKKSIKKGLNIFSDFCKQYLYQILYSLKVDMEYIESLLDYENSESVKK